MFSIDSYIKLISDLKDLNYNFVSYNEVNKLERNIVLRHDIDMSIDLAYDMALIERDMGVSSHYFILVRSGLYNIFEPETSDKLNKIVEFGHSVGLHLDASIYCDDRSGLEKYAEYECKVLESVINKGVEFISFHRPVDSLLDYDQNIAGRMHTYQTKFFKDIGYCSDSKGGWYYGHPLDHDAIKEGSALQLLTHPIWWNNTGNSVQTILDHLSVVNMKKYRDILSDNCIPYNSKLKLKF